MNVIIGMAKTLARTSLNPDQVKYINAIQISSNNLMNIINDILDLSKIEARKIELNISPFSISKLFEEIEVLYQPQTDYKNITLETILDKKIPEVLKSDTNKIKQILINLVGNAIKFTQSGKITLKANLVNSESNGVRVQFVVKDTGIGIKKENYNKIFESFTQLDSSTTKSFPGTGLGLSIVKKFTDLLSGNITFESEYNKGTTFFVELPLNIANSEEHETQTTQKKSEISKRKMLKILLVEDDAINQMYLKNFISSKGWEVDAAKNGLLAIEKFEKSQFDLILMDGQMPKMDGFEATKNIRTIEKENNLTQTPIIAITGYAIEGDKNKFIEAGMDDYITKPINEQKLINMIEKYTLKPVNPE